jgi:precorrin-6A/cobalt-precorrin-6A reductase
MQKLLILGGTTEATFLATSLAGDTRFATILSFAGATRTPRPPPVSWRVGGFGGAEGLAAFLRGEGIDLLIDATHPFAARMKRNAVAAAQIAGIRMLGILRPPWQPQPGDRWTMVHDMAHAASALGSNPRRVLLTIGQKDLAAFLEAPQHRYVVRSIDAPDQAVLPQHATVISARGPFHEEDELALLASHGIDVLVTKNSGGKATAAKLSAARRLGLEVVMVDRPPPPDTETVADAEAGLRWLDHEAARRGV